MAADCGHELRKTNVVCMSLWPGTTRTENVLQASQSLTFEPGKEPIWKVRVYVSGFFGTRFLYYLVVDLNL